ncbi:SGT1 protein-domain-containing protein [Kickxella alabastrina]|uniref:SGT1 protein-domain-containing protein n=1 Tax=Kickxella alabastrina TaxID=61397 RepID=UPI00221F6E45|nr:SGT1 protein-domain-containing protein [Kickxella alabastrina]KAI7834845.1 SGT1 protein-domain-containing protein [Kickxella alabastrina]
MTEPRDPKRAHAAIESYLSATKRIFQNIELDMDNLSDIFGADTGAVDYLRCDIYVQSAGDSSGCPIETDIEKLRSWHARIYSVFTEKTEAYVWNREPLSLFVNTRSKVPCISGQMVHGDSVSDEWLVVWLLHEMTKQFPELIVSVRDSDGEFLLAEAAMHIPYWITPENSQNRVFIFRGRLHIVPLSAASTTKLPDPEHILLQDALSAVVCPNVSTYATVLAERAAFARLEEFPDSMLQNLHTARCKLPTAIARLLACNPQLIAAATEMFYGRDPVQLKECQKMEGFSPEPSVTAMVRFNRVQYAKLVTQSIGALAAFNILPEKSADHKASLLGTKIACGFEILNREGARHPSTSKLHVQSGNERKIGMIYCMYICGGLCVLLILFGKSE